MSFFYTCLTAIFACKKDGGYREDIQLYQNLNTLTGKQHIFCHTFFVLFLSKTTKLNLHVSLHEEVSIDLNFIHFVVALFLSLSLFFCLPKRFPLIALNANIWAFSSFFSFGRRKHYS